MEKQNTPKVSVVCAWYNRSKFIVDSIGSLLNQDYPNYEVIVVNDGSTDEQVRLILDSIKSEKLKVIHQENQGFTQAIINAISKSSGEYIAVHGAGDISNKNRLSSLANIISSNSSIAAVGSGTVQYPVDYPFRKRYFKPDEICNYETLKNKMPFVHGSVIYRRSAYDKAGGYDPRFKYCCDWDLFFRLQVVGDIVSINEFLYEQRIFSDGFSFSPLHKFKQIWFKERAVIRDPVSREMLDNSEVYLETINPLDINYIRFSFDFFLKSIFKFDFKNAMEWAKLILSQIKNKF